MKSAILWLSLVGFFSAALAKSDYFSDISDADYQKLQEIAKFLRSRVQEADASEEVPGRDAEEPGSQSPTDEPKPPFEYNLPLVDPGDVSPPFAVGPSDPRYYQDFGAPLDPTSTAYDSDSLEEGKEKRLRADEQEDVVNTDPFDSGYDSTHSVRDVTIEALPKDGGRDITILALAIVGGAGVLISVFAFAFGCYRLQKKAKLAADVDYPAYGVTGPNKEISPTSGDRRLAQSAQMYHYQHQKQQIIALESMSNKERRSSISDAESEEENEEGDYTVYECPGLAPTGEMEVRNPLFQDDPTPASKPANDTAEEPRELPNLISFD